MKKIPLLLLLMLPMSSFTQSLVEVTNVPLPVEPGVILPTDLRSQSAAVAAAAGKSDTADIQFNDLLVSLKEVTWVVTDPPSSGSCEVRIRINNLLAKIGKWQPPGSIVEIVQPPDAIVEISGDVENFNLNVEIDQPPSALVEKWEPPGSIVFTPNDTLSFEVRSVDTKKNERGTCSAEVLVLGVNALTITDG